MSDNNLKQWRDQANALSAADLQPLSLPKAVFLGQSADFARNTKLRWNPTDGKPSLSKNGNRFTFDIIDEIFSLRLAGLEANAQWLLLVDPKTPTGLTARGREILRELILVIAYVLDDDIEEPADQQFANVKAEHANNGDSSDEVSKALYDFATLADTLRARFADLEDEHLNIDALITEAKKLSQDIAELPPGPQPPSAESQAALDLRNRIFALLEKRIDLIRKAAKVKYELRFPEIAKDFSSAYEKRQRAALARKKKEEADAQEAKDAERQKQIDELKAQLAQERLLAEARTQLENEKK